MRSRPARPAAPGRLTTQARLPLLQANHVGTWSGLMVQNTATQPGTVTVEYGPPPP